MSKQTKMAILTSFMVIVAVIMAGKFLSGSVTHDKTYDRIMGEQWEQLEYEKEIYGYDDHDDHIVKVRIVE